jgi:hypothetical protein
MEANNISEMLANEPFNTLSLGKNGTQYLVAFIFINPWSCLSAYLTLKLQILITFCIFGKEEFNFDSYQYYVTPILHHSQTELNQFPQRSLIIQRICT